MKELLWNSDSAVLVVWLEDMSAGEDGQANAYSKFTIRFSELSATDATSYKLIFVKKQEQEKYR